MSSIVDQLDIDRLMVNSKLFKDVWMCVVENSFKT